MPSSFACDQLKVSLRSPKMLPTLAIVEPEVTYSLPAKLTASTGMDALTQLIEQFLSSRANQVTDVLCREMIHELLALARSLRKCDGQARPRRNVAGKPLWRPCVGERRSRGRSWIRRANRRDVSCAAWSDLRRI